jgi:RNA polymerase sigma-70 factor (ECF subfamily)
VSGGVEPTLDLVERIRAGDEEAWSGLFLRHAARLLVFVHFRMGERLRALWDPSDVLQEVYLTAFQEFARYRGEAPGAFYLWLKGIARNHLRNLRRTAGARKREVLRPLPSTTGLEAATPDTRTPSRLVAESEEFQSLRRRIEALDPPYRSVLLLRYYDGLSAPEVARALRITPDAVYQRLHRALVALGGTGPRG